MGAFDTLPETWVIVNKLLAVGACLFGCLGYGFVVLCVVEALPTLLDIAVREAVERILGKVREGKKLSDAEVTLLLVGELAKRITALEKRVEEVRDELSRRIDDSRDMMATRIIALEKRVEGLEKRVEGLEGEVKGLRTEVSLIRSDVIMLLKGWVEKEMREERGGEVKG